MTFERSGTGFDRESMDGGYMMVRDPLERARTSECVERQRQVIIRYEAEENSNSCRKRLPALTNSLVVEVCSVFCAVFMRVLVPKTCWASEWLRTMGSSTITPVPEDDDGALRLSCRAHP